jgi:hypothetical protein
VVLRACRARRHLRSRRAWALLGVHRPWRVLGVAAATIGASPLQRLAELSRLPRAVRGDPVSFRPPG